MFNDKSLRKLLLVNIVSLSFMQKCLKKNFAFSSKTLLKVCRRTIIYAFISKYLSLLNSFEYAKKKKKIDMRKLEKILLENISKFLTTIRNLKNFSYTHFK